MRKVIYAINMTLDGICDHTKVAPGEGVMKYYIDLVREAGMFAYGRKTYELMVPYWPDIAKEPKGADKEDVEFAEAFVAVKETVVFSQTLKRVGGPNTRIVRTDPGIEIKKLKKGSGKPILLGGVELPMQLIEQDLVDEYRLVIAPILAGEGRRLWDGLHLPKNRPLKLAWSKTFPGGSVALRYVRP
jgi:dihydrofolate reductase